VEKTLKVGERRNRVREKSNTEKMREGLGWVGDGVVTCESMSWPRGGNKCRGAKGLKGRFGCYLHDMTYENFRERERERERWSCLGVRALGYVGRRRGCFL
jgi:hypothetical protein